MKRGEVSLVNLDPTVGAEMKKSRPCVIVNRDSFVVCAAETVAPTPESAA